MINIPKEFIIPGNPQVIFVSDFWPEDLIGGAELTLDACARVCPVPYFKLHANSLTEQMLKQHRDKIWIFGNQTQINHYLLNQVITLGIHYYFFEMDFKTCLARSTIKHELQTKKPCDCHSQLHGQFLSYWMTNSKTLFWCSDLQREKFYGIYPHLRGKTTDFTQGSTYYPETILNIRKIREKKEAGEIQVLDRWCILQSDSWIKGTDDSIAYCKEHRLNYVLLHNLTNEKFLEELAISRGYIFMTRDIDVGSRVVSECKLLGGQPIVNDFVLHVKEDWFKQPIPRIEEYLLDGPARFWRQIKL